MALPFLLISYESELDSNSTVRCCIDGCVAVSSSCYGTTEVTGGGAATHLTSSGPESESESELNSIVLGGGRSELNAIAADIPKSGFEAWGSTDYGWDETGASRTSDY